MVTPVNWNNVSMLTPGLKNLGNQFNRRWPKRDGASDGAAGDYAHTQEHSGHNPDDTSKHNAEWDSDSDNKPDIRAIDVDSDLGEPGTNMQMVIDHMRKLPNLGNVIRYMIYNRKMYNVNNGFNPVDYTGSSAHTEHAHFSGAWTDASDENTTFDFKFEEVGDMAFTQEDKDFIASFFKPGKQGDNVSVTSPVGQVTLNQGIPNGVTGKKTFAWEAIRDLGVSLNGISTAIAAIAAKVDLDPSELEAIKATLAVPTAEQNAQAVLAALGGVPMGTLAQTLKEALSAPQLDELVSLLNQ